MQTFTQRLAFGILLFFCTIPTLIAQSNNDCSGAFEIVDPGNFCSPLNAGQNLFATPSNVPVPGCFTGAPHDVWFSFTAIAPNVVIVINGASSTPGGTLLSPAVALYEGSCDALNLLGCEADPLFFGVVELRVENLIPGNQYFFRVDGATPGTFQFCVRNFFFDGGISGDCPMAIPLCDKSSFNVQAVAGPGADPFELDDAPCLDFDFAESNSTWFTFTIANNGTLEFILTPNNAADDLDFVVYRLPSGMGNCNDKIIERCMAAGDFDPSSPCMGPTGLNAVATEISHSSGCLGINETNFLRFMDVQAGNTYALVVNNFTSSGNGFQVDWGGTATFTGPLPAIKTNDPDGIVCLGDSIVFSDSSSFQQGIITDWVWTFGESATPAMATTSGPHSVSYQTPGQKLITMTIKTSLGCEVSATRQILVENTCQLFEVPNAFTPNADQINDRFRPVLYAGALVNLLIWSRWGELVYEGDSPEGWDGTFDGELAPSDVYVYQLLIRLPNGVEEKRHGDVTLLR